MKNFVGYGLGSKSMMAGKKQKTRGTSRTPNPNKK